MLTCIDDQAGLILVDPLLNGAFRGNLGCCVDGRTGHAGRLASLDSLFVECVCGDREPLIRLRMGDSK